MAYSTPKTSWVAGDVPAPSDFNRIEGNMESNHNEIDDILNNAISLSGAKTFPDGIKTDAISEKTSGVGVTVEGVTMKDGIIYGIVWGA